MGVARPKVVEGATGPCPSCGASGNPRLRLVIDGSEKVAWEGCSFCLGLAIARHQEETLRQLCRSVEKAPRPERNVSALY